MITGRVMMESVSEADRMLMPKLKKQHEQSQPEQAVNHRRHAARLMMAMRIRRVQGLSSAYSADVDAGSQPERDGKERRAQHQVECADDGRQDAARAHPVARHGGQEFPT